MERSRMKNKKIKKIVDLEHEQSSDTSAVGRRPSNLPPRRSVAAKPPARFTQIGDSLQDEYGKMVDQSKLIIKVRVDRRSSVSGKILAARSRRTHRRGTKDRAHSHLDGKESYCPRQSCYL